MGLIVLVLFLMMFVKLECDDGFRSQYMCGTERSLHVCAILPPPLPLVVNSAFDLWTRSHQAYLIFAAALSFGSGFTPSRASH